MLGTRPLFGGPNSGAPRTAPEPTAKVSDCATFYRSKPRVRSYDGRPRAFLSTRRANFFFSVNVSPSETCDFICGGECLLRRLTPRSPLPRRYHPVRSPHTWHPRRKTQKYSKWNIRSPPLAGP